jgi:uncharacterized protein YdhG (YjbR/CyaY superfamily)
MAYRSVGDYINQAPASTQALARQIRRIIKEAAPEAEEKISYQMPYYSYYGRLIYFGAYKDYVGLYIMSGAAKALVREVKDYQTTPSTLRFPADQPLPIALIKKIVKTQAKFNEQHQKTSDLAK